ncbi:MAG: DUF1330 domain-containing protein [Pseudomonadota bacterium]
MTEAFITPTREDYTRFMDLEIEGPVHMLNLIKLRHRAAYEDGRDVTGEQAYATYSELSAPFFAGVGGQVIWQGRAQMTLIGSGDGDAWDFGFIAAYPSKAAIDAMFNDPGYQAITFHRSAAIENSRLHCFAVTQHRQGSLV